MYCYYDEIENKKIVSIISETKVDYLGDNYIISDIPDGHGILIVNAENKLEYEKTNSIDDRIADLEIALSEMIGGGE